MTKKWMVTGLTMGVLVCSIIIGGKIVKKDQTIMSYQGQLVNYANAHISYAKSQLEFASTTKEQERIPLALREAEEELDTAREMIGMWSIYFTYKRTDHIAHLGNGDADRFFRSYQEIFHQWQEELLRNPNAFQYEKINLALKDITKVYKTFAVYSNNREAIKEMTYDEITNLLIGLAKETETEEIKQKLKEDFLFFYE